MKEQKNEYNSNHKYLSDDFLNEFNNYNDLMENYLMLNYFKESKNLKIDPSSLKTDYELIEFSKNAFEQTIFYPQSFRTSFFIQLFSVLEHELKEICLNHHQENKTDFSIIDLKGNSEIEKAKLYLKKSCKINFEVLEPDWSYLEIMRKIRNRFVHNQGEINQKHPDWKIIFNFVKKNKNQLGFRTAAEYLEDEKFNKIYDKDYFFMLDIQDPLFNYKMILTLKSFLKKLVTEFDSMAQ